MLGGSVVCGYYGSFELKRYHGDILAVFLLNVWWERMVISHILFANDTNFLWGQFQESLVSMVYSHMFRVVHKFKKIRNSTCWGGTRYSGILWCSDSFVLMKYLGVTSRIPIQTTIHWGIPLLNACKGDWLDGKIVIIERLSLHSSRVCYLVFPLISYLASHWKLVGPIEWKAPKGSSLGWVWRRI